MQALQQHRGGHECSPDDKRSGPSEADNRRDHEIGEDVLGLPTKARAGQPIAGTQLGECDGGNGHCNAAKFQENAHAPRCCRLTLKVWIAILLRPLLREARTSTVLGKRRHQATDPIVAQPAIHQIGEQTSQHRSNWRSASVYNGGHLYISPAQAARVSRGEHGNHA